MAAGWPEGLGELMPTRLPRGRNERLELLLARSGMSRGGLAKRVNDLGALMGVSLRYDYTYVYRWIDKGQRPQEPGPHLIATVLTQALGQPVSLEDIGMGEDGTPVKPFSVADIDIGDDRDGRTVEPWHAQVGPVAVPAEPGVAVRVTVSITGVPATGMVGPYGVEVTLTGPPSPEARHGNQLAPAAEPSGTDAARVYVLADARRRRDEWAG